MSRKVALDKDVQHLGFWREGQDWTRLTILTYDFATGEQQPFGKCLMDPDASHSIVMKLQISLDRPYKTLHSVIGNDPFTELSPVAACPSRAR